MAYGAVGSPACGEHGIGAKDHGKRPGGSRQADDADETDQLVLLGECRHAVDQVEQDPAAGQRRRADQERPTTAHCRRQAPPRAAGRRYAHHDLVRAGHGGDVDGKALVEEAAEGFAGVGVKPVRVAEEGDAAVSAQHSSAGTTITMVVCGSQTDGSMLVPTADGMRVYDVFGDDDEARCQHGALVRANGNEGVIDRPQPRARRQGDHRFNRR
ncbi:MAG: hypothetical protein ACRERC_17050 [Candidatus Binatia bacterium]